MIFLISSIPIYYMKFWSSIKFDIEKQRNIKINVDLLLKAIYSVSTYACTIHLYKLKKKLKVAKKNGFSKISFNFLEGWKTLKLYNQIC